MTPFRFERDRHYRRADPGPFKRYQEYKAALRVDFARKCVYCRLPDTAGANTENFGVEHYRPKSKFPEYRTVYTNLFYACNACNRRKGEYWPAKGQETTLFFPNPCDHSMRAHVDFVEGATVEGHTTAGKFMVASLSLNHPDVVAYRNVLNTSIAESRRVVARCERLIRGLRDKRRAASPAGQADLDQAIAHVEKRRADAEAVVARFMGRA